MTRVGVAQRRGKFSADARKRLSDAMKQRWARRHEAERNGLPARRKIDPIVYHAPKEEYPINYCPNCGKHLGGYRQ